MHFVKIMTFMLNISARRREVLIQPQLLKMVIMGLTVKFHLQTVLLKVYSALLRLTKNIPPLTQKKIWYAQFVIVHVSNRCCIHMVC